MNQTAYKKKYKPCAWCKSKNVRFAWTEQSGSFRVCADCGQRVKQ